MEELLNLQKKKKYIAYIIVLFLISCNGKNAEKSDTKNTSISTEQKILKLIPSDYTESGFSRSGIYSGDCNIYFKNDVLNITYLILGNEITERGIAKDLVLTSNVEGTMMLLGKWDNQDAGDGKVLILLKDENRVYIEVDGLDGANWWYKAECTIQDKDYDELFYLFHGYKRDVQKTKSNFPKSPDSLNSTSSSAVTTKQDVNVEITKENKTNTSDNEEKERVKVNKTIIGDWYNEEVNGTLTITKDGASFWGGPFTERLKIIREKDEVKLYFDYIEGTNNFNEAVNSSSINKKNKCKKLVAKCVFKNNLLFYEGFGDDCGQLPKGNFILKAS